MAIVQFKQQSAKPKQASAVPKQQTNALVKNDGTPSLWPSLGAASAVQGITAGLAQSAQNSAYKLQAEQYEQQKLMAAQNEKLAKMAVANAYSSGAYQAMMQGLQDAQIISQTRASRASSGVRMDVGSAREIEASQRISAALNQAQIQKNTTAAAVNAKLQQANYQVEQIIAQGNADAARAMESDSWLAGLSSFITSAGMYDLAIQGTGTADSPFTSFFKNFSF